MDRNCRTTPIISNEIAQTCDELNNVLTAIMLRAGLIVGGNAGPEIESLSMRAKISVQNLRVIADALQDREKGVLIGNASHS